VPGTTPDSLRVQKLLASMRDRGATAAVLECSPEAIQQGHLDWVELDVAVFTSFSSAEAELLCGPGSTLDGPEGVLAAYMELFHQLVGGKEQRAVVNKDDPTLHLLLEALGEDVPVVTYALDNETADVFPLDVKYSIWETELLVRTPLGKLQIITPLLGKHNVYNVLAAVTTGIAMNVPLQAIVAGGALRGCCCVHAFAVVVDACQAEECRSCSSGLPAPACSQHLAVRHCSSLS
jgi:UDP-N-acetylmuramoyl-L-alanyl-D-glutamate--2,6-diaminopimelate ligase